MKAQFILLFLLASVISSNVLASDTDPKQDQKKTTKSKYDFNIFKLHSIASEQQLPDTLKVEIKALPPKRRKN